MLTTLATIFAGVVWGTLIAEVIEDLLNYIRYRNIISDMSKEKAQGKTKLLGNINAKVDSVEKKDGIYRVKTKCRDSHGHTEEWFVRAKELDNDMWAAVKEKRKFAFYV